jgi:hypothetical protein
MPKTRVSVSRAVVASPAPRDGDPPAPPATPSLPVSNPRGSGELEKPRASSNVRSSSRSRIPLGARDSSYLSPPGDVTPASSSLPKKSG